MTNYYSPKTPYNPTLSESDGYLYRQSEPTMNFSLGFIPEEHESSDRGKLAIVISC